MVSNRIMDELQPHIVGLLRSSDVHRISAVELLAAAVEQKSRTPMSIASRRWCEVESQMAGGNLCTILECRWASPPGSAKPSLTPTCFFRWAAGG